MAPFLLAAFFGLLISALLYFVFMWPSREPPEPDTDSEAAEHGPDPGTLDRAAGQRQGG
jgi:hypothetical protein